MRLPRSFARSAAPAHVGDLADGRDRIRWFPALVGNHVVDLVNKYQGDLPEALTHYVRGKTGSDGIHYNGEDAIRWANGVMENLVYVLH